jgi:hypothetical protein
VLEAGTGDGAIASLARHPPRQREGTHKHIGELGAGGDLAGEVADDAPEQGADALERAVRPLELLGVGIALVSDQRLLADPHIGLAQHETGLLPAVPGALAAGASAWRQSET